MPTLYKRHVLVRYISNLELHQGFVQINLVKTFSGFFFLFTVSRCFCVVFLLCSCVIGFIFGVSFLWSLFVHKLSSFWRLWKTVLRNCDIYWVSSLIILHIRFFFLPLLNPLSFLTRCITKTRLFKYIESVTSKT